MRFRLLFLSILFLFFGVRTGFAVSFTISNPQYNNSEVTIDVLLSGLTSSSCLNGVCYLQAAFTSPSPIRYFGFTKNNNAQWYQYISSPTQSYIQSTFFNFQPIGGTWSGQLTLKVNAEDSNYHGPGSYNIKAWRYSGNSNSASGDSGVISVNIPASIPTPTPSPNLTTSPTITSFSPSPSSNTTSSSFLISNVASQVNSNQSFSTTINLSLPANPSTTFYLKGAFKKANGSNYFGQTKVSDNWVKNSGSYSSQYQINTDSSGNWTGNLEVQSDSSDSGFTGTGDYIFKVGRYTSSGSGPSWSNEAIIKIIAVENLQAETLETTSSPTIPPSGSPLVKTGIISSTETKGNGKLKYRIASVAAATTEASLDKLAKVNVKNQKQTNPFFWAGLIFVFTGTASIGYIYLKKNGKIHF